MSEQPEITEELAEVKWHRELAPAIEAVMDRLQDPSEFQVSPRSVLGDDDMATAPYQLSHSARWCLKSGVDHLHALKTLIVDARVMHSSASYGLARGALENIGAGFWILHSDDPAIRIAHSLRWWAKNFKDQELATKTIPSRTPLAVKLDRIEALGRATSCDLAMIRKRYTSGEVLEYVDTNSTASRPHLIWQICSGFAHGRPWADLLMNEMEQRPTEASGISLARFTADHTRLLTVAMPAMHLLEDLLRLYRDRSTVA